MTAQEVRRHLLRALDEVRPGTEPFPHWLIDNPLLPALPAAIAGLPIAPPFVLKTLGKHETNNSTRSFFSAANRARFPVCDAVAAALQDDAVVARLTQICGADLHGTYLRIEYCQDTDGFWLEPHTDIGAKRFTMLIYLSAGPEAQAWGTDLMTPEGAVVASVPCRVNSGVIFVPASDTWHGFRRRPITGVRRSLIVNYVGPEWRSRHELAYPSQPVT